MLKLSNIAAGGMQVEDGLGDLDDTQVAGRKRCKEDNVAKEMLTCFAENAAGRAKLKAITSRLLRDAAERDRRLAERDKALVENLTGLVERSFRLDG